MKMSNVVAAANTNNVTHAKSQQANDSLNHFIRGNHHLFEKTSSRAEHNSNQNSNPELIKKSALCELESNVVAYNSHHHHQNNNRQPPPDDTICMRSLNNTSSVIVGAPGNDLSNTTTGCHCLAPNQQQQHQPLQQQSCNKYPDNGGTQLGQSANLAAAHKITINAGSFASSCTTVIRTNHNSNSNSDCIAKGLKRPNDTDEPRGPIAVVISSSHSVSSSKFVDTPSGNNVTEPVTATSAEGSPRRLLGENSQTQKRGQVETGGDNDYINEEEDEDDDDEDDESNFDYEPVLIEILNEKKLALSNSPNVIKFLLGFRKHQQQQQQQPICP